MSEVRAPISTVSSAPVALSSEDELRALKNKFDRGVLTQEQYTKEKAKVLETLK